MFSHFGNLGFLGGMQPHPIFGMQPQGMPIHYPGAFNPQPMGGVQPSWGSSPQPIGPPMQMQPGMPRPPVQGTMQRYPLMSSMMGGMQSHPAMGGMMPGRINLGALGGGQMNSQMMRSPQAY